MEKNWKRKTFLLQQSRNIFHIPGEGSNLHVYICLYLYLCIIHCKSDWKTRSYMEFVPKLCAHQTVMLWGLHKLFWFFCKKNGWEVYTSLTTPQSLHCLISDNIYNYIHSIPKMPFWNTILLILECMLCICILKCET